MLLPIALILIVLGILLFVLRAVFGFFPNNWEWFGIALAGSGLAMTTPTVFQMIWGKPILEVEFDRYGEGNKLCLLVFLKNQRVKNRVLRKFGIRRDPIHSLTAQFRISEVGSSKIIDPIRQAKLYSDEEEDKGRYRIALPATYSVAASFMVILWNPKTNRAFIPPDRLRPGLEIPPGYYQATFVIEVDGEPMNISRRFKIGQKIEDLVWVNDTTRFSV